VVAWRCKKQAISTLHSTGSEIISLTDGVKKTINIRDFTANIGYPFGDGTHTLEDNQGTIKTVESSRLHDNTRHLATHISWLNEQYTMGIIKLMYTNTILQLADINTKPLCVRHFQSILAYAVGIHFYPTSYSQQYRSLYLDVCRLLSDYMTYGKPVPISGSD
jgi:hypothetical protein